MGEMIHLDFTGVKVGFDPIPEGLYYAHVQEVTQETSKQGNPMLAVRYTIMEGEHAGRLMFANYSLLPQALWKMRQLLEALDPAGDYAGPMSFQPGDLIDLSCVLGVVVDEYDGKLRNKIERVLPSSTPVVVAEPKPELDAQEAIPF